MPQHCLFFLFFIGISAAHSAFAQPLTPEALDQAYGEVEFEVLATLRSVSHPGTPGTRPLPQREELQSVEDRLLKWAGQFEEFLNAPGSIEYLKLSQQPYLLNTFYLWSNLMTARSRQWGGARERYHALALNAPREALPFVQLFTEKMPSLLGEPLALISVQPDPHHPHQVWFKLHPSQIESIEAAQLLGSVTKKEGLFEFIQYLAARHLIQNYGFIQSLLPADQLRPLSTSSSFQAHFSALGNGSHHSMKIRQEALFREALIESLKNRVLRKGSSLPPFFTPALSNLILNALVNAAVVPAEIFQDLRRTIKTLELEGLGESLRERLGLTFIELSEVQDSRLLEDLLMQCLSASLKALSRHKINEIALMSLTEADESQRMQVAQSLESREMEYFKENEAPLRDWIREWISEVRSKLQSDSGQNELAQQTRYNWIEILLRQSPLIEQASGPLNREERISTEALIAALDPQFSAIQPKREIRELALKLLNGITQDSPALTEAWYAFQQYFKGLFGNEVLWQKGSTLLVHPKSVRNAIATFNFSDLIAKKAFPPTLLLPTVESQFKSVLNTLYDFGALLGFTHPHLMNPRLDQILFPEPCRNGGVPVSEFIWCNPQTNSKSAVQEITLSYSIALKKELKSEYPFLSSRVGWKNGKEQTLFERLSEVLSENSANALGAFQAADRLLLPLLSRMQTEIQDQLSRIGNIKEISRENVKSVSEILSSSLLNQLIIQRFPETVLAMSELQSQLDQNGLLKEAVHFTTPYSQTAFAALTLLQIFEYTVGIFAPQSGARLFLQAALPRNAGLALLGTFLPGLAFDYYFDFQDYSALKKSTANAQTLARLEIRKPFLFSSDIAREKELRARLKWREIQRRLTLDASLMLLPSAGALGGIARNAVGKLFSALIPFFRGVRNSSGLILPFRDVLKAEEAFRQLGYGSGDFKKIDPALNPETIPSLSSHSARQKAYQLLSTFKRSGREYSSEALFNKYGSVGNRAANARIIRFLKRAQRRSK